MKWITRILFILIIAICLHSNSNAQTYFINHDIPYSTSNQNMWGPNGSPFNINVNFDLFHVAFDTAISIGYMDTILGEPVGAMFNIDTWFVVGSTFDMHGWTTGWLDVDYPVEINLEVPNNYTFNPGEVVTIHSDYEVQPGWELYSHFPQAGVISLDLDFGFGLNIDADVCLVGCDSISIMNIQVPTDSIVIFYLNGLTGETIYPCADPSSPLGFGFCHDTILPITFNNLFGIGLSGWITLPYIETTDWLDSTDQCHQILGANGDSTYMNLDIDIIQFLSAVAGLIPPPQGPAIQQFLGMLNGTYDAGGGITIDYSLLTAHMSITNTMQQDLTFNPTVNTVFTFPTPVEYFVSDPNNGNAIVDQGVSDSIAFATCMDFNYRYPCFGWPQMPIGIAAHLDNDFTNHVWDSIAFTFLLTALEFDIHIPFPILKSVTVPEFCIKVPFNCADSTCYYEICSPEITNEPYCALKDSHGGPIYDDGDGDIDPPHILDWDYHIGPLVDLSLPLGYIPLTWYNNTWELAGFDTDTTFDGIIMIPNPVMEIVSVTDNDNVCFGDSIGNITITMNYGTLPYIFTWSNGVIDTSFSNVNTQTGLLSGIYGITVSDINGCTLTAVDTITETNPPIFVTLTPTHVLCNGGITGSITSNVWGGTPGYTYQWTPIGGVNPNAINLPAGIYSLSVTDAAGCPQTATTTITEPAAPVLITLDSIVHVLCFNGNNGAISITVVGGSPGYTYNWSNGNTVQDISNLTANTYTVTVTDTHLCTEIFTETVTQPPLLLSAIASTNVSCYGLSDGTANLIVSGGVPPYNFIWNNGEITEDLSNLSYGDYTVTITDQNLCTSVSSIYITQPQAPLSATYIVTDVLCHGLSIGAINVSPTGGTLPYAYEWSSGQTTQDLNNILAGNYSVTITDFNLCSYTTNATVSEPPQAVATIIIATDVRCFGEVNGAADLTVTGGVPPYVIEWNTGSSLEDINTLYAGIYYVTVTDSHNCSVVDSVKIIEPGELFASITENVRICIGDTANIIVSATGGTAWYSYLWNTGQTDTLIHVLPNVTTNYKVTVTDNHGCIATDIEAVYVYPPLTAEINVDKDTICPGEAVLITGNISGGNSQYSVSLNDTIIINLPYVYYPLVSSQYVITVEDNCSTPPIVFYKDIIVLASPPIGFLADVTSDCAPLTVSFNEVSPIIGQTYIWNFGDDNSSNTSIIKNPQHIYEVPGTYDVSLTVTSMGGCTSYSEIPEMIHVYPNPDAKFITNPIAVNIINPSVNFINLSTDANDYLWYFGDGDSTSEVNPHHIYLNIPNQYIVTLIALNSYGCSDTTKSNMNVSGDYTFYAPSAFSPDADDRNEVFKVYATNIDFESFKLFIVDRWGEIIFNTNDINTGWDGRAKGSELVQVGSYTWMASFKDMNGVTRNKTGAVTVIR
ncbi:MAG: gliding motility-associated C-terminal domain-containing protein [Bacteroidia bacterium]|nr:gliding motility-associated C-terminal domain-containing protein [Bacteroidia bacterium]